MVSRRTSERLSSSSPISRAVAAAVEPLERRQLLSSVKFTDPDGDGLADIVVTGTSGTDKITIYMDPLHNFAAVHDDKNGNGKIDKGELSYGGQFETIDVSTLGGTDTVNVRLLSDLAGSLSQSQAAEPLGARPVKGASLPDVEYYGEGISVYVDLGTGNDKFEFSSPTTLDSTIAAKLTDAAGFDVTADEDGADIIEGGDLVVQADGGNDKDTINFDFSRTSVICASLIATSDAGSGDDTVNLKLPDFKGAGFGDSNSPEEGVVACFDYYYLPDNLVSSRETYYGEGLVVPSNVSVAIDLGSGKNTLNITAHTFVSASNVHIEVDGGKDTDIINDLEEIVATSNIVVLGSAPTLSANEVIRFPSAPATYVVDIELGSGDDTYNQTVEFANNVRTEVGTTSLEIDFNGAVTYNVRGDSGKDTIKVKDVENDSPPEQNTAFIDGSLTYNLYGGNDDDNVQFDTNPGSQFGMAGGQLNVLVSCDGGNDFGRIDLALVPFELSGGTAAANLTLSGGTGNDKLGMMVEVVSDLLPVSAPGAKGVIALTPLGFFGARGYPLLDGGAGTDKYDTEGNVIIVTRGAETLDESIEPAYVP